MKQNATTPLPRAPEIPRPGRGALRVLAWLVVLTMIYAYGWKVTQIDLVELATKWSLARPLLLDLVRPDLLQYYPRQQRVDAGIGLDGGTAPPPEISGEGRVTLTPASAKIGDRVTVTAEGFAPSRPIEVIWRDQAGSTATVAKGTTDASGRFETAITVPNVIGTAHHIIAQVTLEGTTLGLSNTLRLTLFRMVETIFLALMGTTMAVVFAVPLSFLAAKNLMGRSAASLSVYYVMRTIFNIARSIEPLIMATVFAVWVGIGPFAGVLALGVHSIASL
ncbi:MAG: phosphonate ABC transporter, permease protein PhnE, partial [bacterium]